MKTIRSYSNVAEAGFAQSLLEAAGIQANLVGENAGTIFPPLVPWGIKLEVPDADAESALDILDRKVAMSSLAPSPSPSSPAVEQEVDSPLLTEIRSLRRSHQTSAALCILLLIIALIYLPSQLRPLPAPHPSQTDSWEKVRAAIDRFEYDKATMMTERIVAKYPNDYYGYSYLGYVALAAGRVADAERQYARAYELFPTEENEKNLRAVRKRMEKESLKQPASPNGG